MEANDSTDRLLDASLNRAAEGLRVVEDVCRFHWSLPGIARELKELRHELLAAGRDDAARHLELLHARDIEGDVGRGSDVAAREARGLPLTAFRNLERAREALRTLEEVRRPRDAREADVFQSIRYRLYALEKGLARLDVDRSSIASSASARTQRLEGTRLYLLATEDLCRGGLEPTVRSALEAGVGMVQMRQVGRPDREVLATGRRLRELTARHGALLVINDRPDLATLCHADGVHLGQDDIPLAEARSLLGEAKIIGRSTHSLDQARRAWSEGADYIGVGPVFASRTKEAGPPMGPAELRRILEAVPVLAFPIGGIDESNIEAVVAAGARRVAVSSAVLSSEDVSAAVSRLLGVLDAGRGDA